MKTDEPLSIINRLKIIFLLATLLGFASCKQISQSHQLTFQVTNKTQENINYMSLSTSQGQGKTVRSDVSKDATVDIEFNFNQIDKTDGGYQLKYKLASATDTLTENFGYYTNGYPLEKTLVLTVYTDSVSVDRIP